MRAVRFGPRHWIATTLLAGAASLAACTETIPSGPDDEQLPEAPLTVTLQLAWADFGSNLQVYGGYGTTDETPASVVASAFAGVEARTLMTFDLLPTSAQVRDASDELQVDTALTFVDAYVVARFDTLASTSADTVTLTLGETLEGWETETASWTHARDTPTNQVTWSQPGGGAVLPIDTRTWDRATGDSVLFFLDSAQVARWRTGPDSVRTARMDLVSPGHRLKLSFAALRLVATSFIDPDTILVLDVGVTGVTFIYDPQATPPTDGFRVGGSPAWRTVLDVALPDTLNGPPELCAVAGCPFVLAARNVSYAGLGLRSRRPPDAFRPTDSISVDVRAVLHRPALPKSPLGVSLAGEDGTAVAPALFAAGEGTLVDVPVTGFVQAFLAGPDAAGRPPSSTIAILSTPEPATFGFGEFFGPGGPNEPVLKLILTVSPPLELP
jgi:hypothetical protein